MMMNSFRFHNDDNSVIDVHGIGHGKGGIVLNPGRIKSSPSSPSPGMTSANFFQSIFGNLLRQFRSSTSSRTNQLDDNDDKFKTKAKLQQQNGSNGYHKHHHQNGNGFNKNYCDNQIKIPEEEAPEESLIPNYLTCQQKRMDLIIILLCFVCYLNSLKCDFVFDDISAIKHNKDLRYEETTIFQLFRNDFWGQPMDNEKSHKSYRPLCVLTFRLNYLIHGLDPFGYHLVNVLLHILVSLQYFRFCRLFMSSLESSFIAAILFSVHPIHTEAVTSVVGRAETLCATFFLTTIFFYLKATRKSTTTDWPMFITSIMMMAIATFSKEQGITSMVICLILELIFNQKLPKRFLLLLLNDFRWFRKLNNYNNNVTAPSSSSSSWSFPKWIKEMLIRIILLITFTIIILSIRLKLMQWQLPVFTKFDNPAASAPSPIRQLTHNYLVAFNFWLLLNPMDLCCDWTMGSIPLIETIFDKRNISTFLLYFLLISLFYKYLRQTLTTLVKTSNTTLARRISSNNIVGHANGNGIHLDNGHNHNNRRNIIVNSKSSTKSTTKKRFDENILLISLSLMIFPFIPASNLFFPVGFVIAERILYIPSFGFCMLISYGIMLLYYGRQQESKRGKGNKRLMMKYVLLISLLLIILIFTIRTILRNEDWRTEKSIFYSGVKINKNNAKLFNNIGHVYEQEKQYEKALEYFLKASQIQNNDIGAFSNVARIYEHLKNYDLAEKYYSYAKNIFMKELEEEENIEDLNGRRIARIAPSHLGMFLNLANLIARNHSRLDEADLLYRQIIKMRSDYVEAYINRGDILLRMNRTIEANHIYWTALRYDNQNADIYYNLGIVAIHLNKLDIAIQHFDKALQLNPNHSQALFNYAIVVQDAQRKDLFNLAKERLNKLSKIDPTNERIFFNLAMISMIQKHFKDAENWFRQTLKLNPNHQSANFNLALLLTENSRPIESLPYLKRLLENNPKHIKGLLLLGDIFIDHIKNFDKAAEYYRKILKLDPHNIQAKHNLCVVFVEKNQLDKAERCLDEVREIAPNQDYIDRHMKIVKLRILKKRKLLK